MNNVDYVAALRSAYVGELVGERLYRELAVRRTSDDERAKLDAIASVERLTYERLRPIATRLGIQPVETEWRPIVERRTAQLAPLCWSDFIDKALLDWPPYIARFAAIAPLAPPCDQAALTQLVDHEVALVEFARRERAAPGSAESLRVLQAFLGAAACDAGEGNPSL
jgi:hypothetical protein